jgi:hypothetical protein
MTPRRFRNVSAWVSKMCVERVSLGKLACSTSATFTPRRASSAASGDPEQRAPTTITSNSWLMRPPISLFASRSGLVASETDRRRLVVHRSDGVFEPAAVA